MENIKLEGVLKEIERRIENELGMDEGELAKSLLEAHQDDNYFMIADYSLQIYKNHIARKQNFSSDACKCLIGIIQLIHTLSLEKQPSPSEPYVRYSDREGGNRR